MDVNMENIDGGRSRRRRSGKNMVPIIIAIIIVLAIIVVFVVLPSTCVWNDIWTPSWCEEDINKPDPPNTNPDNLKLNGFQLPLNVPLEKYWRDVNLAYDLFPDETRIVMSYFIAYNQVTYDFLPIEIRAIYLDGTNRETRRVLADQISSLVAESMKFDSSKTFAENYKLYAQNNNIAMMRFEILVKLLANDKAAEYLDWNKLPENELLQPDEWYIQNGEIVFKEVGKTLPNKGHLETHLYRPLDNFGQSPMPWLKNVFYEIVGGNPGYLTFNWPNDVSRSMEQRFIDVVGYKTRLDPEILDVMADFIMGVCPNMGYRIKLAGVFDCDTGKFITIPDEAKTIAPENNPFENLPAKWKKVGLKDVYDSESGWMYAIINEITSFGQNYWPNELKSLFWTGFTSDSIGTLKSTWISKMRALSGGVLTREFADEVSTAVCNLYKNVNIGTCTGPTPQTCSNCYSNDINSGLGPCKYSCGGFSTNDCAPMGLPFISVFPDPFWGNQESTCYRWYEGNTCNWLEQLNKLKISPMVDFNTGKAKWI